VSRMWDKYSSRHIGGKYSNLWKNSSI
jgi:hypothetical protein